MNLVIANLIFIDIILLGMAAATARVYYRTRPQPADDIEPVEMPRYSGFTAPPVTREEEPW